MCNCKNVEIGSYDNQVIRLSWWNNKEICIDKCIVDEIELLWDNEIRTEGCCCGHNKLKAMINVHEGHHQRMINLGYKFWINIHDTICYEPKSC